LLDRFLRGIRKKAINRMTVTGLVDGLERGFKETQPFETLFFSYRISP
jgi:hypothetical protein